MWGAVGLHHVNGAYNRPYWYQLPVTAADAGHPHYVKCYNAPSPTPLNNRRIQYASQEGTANIDPSLPKINATDPDSCLRMIKFVSVLID